MALHGKLGEFTSGKEDWKSYTERLTQYFAANDIDDVAKQRAILISSCGAATYRLMKDVLSPTSPSEVAFAAIVTTMGAHFQPPPSEIMQRFRFNSRIRRPHETVATYLAQLKQLAEYCKFGVTLSPMLRDRLVCGIADERWQKRLLAEEDLTYDKAVKLLLSMEAAESEVKDLTAHKTVNSVRRPGKPAFSKPPHNKAGDTPSTTCYRCGAGHKATDCSYKDAECHFCHKKGHIASVCLSKQRQKRPSKPGFGKRTHQVTEAEGGEMSDTELPEYDLFIVRPEGNRPWIVELAANQSELKMEVDTGAALSIISMATYSKLWPEGDTPPLQPTSAKLRSYTGMEIGVEGAIDVDVEYQDQQATLPLVVVAGSGPSLLGATGSNTCGSIGHNCTVSAPKATWEFKQRSIATPTCSERD